MNEADSLPTSVDLTGPCPRCGRVSNFKLQEQTGLAKSTGGALTEIACVLMCMGCNEGTVVIEELNRGAGRRPLHWWPIPSGGALDAAVPERVASCYTEGMRCLSVHAARAAVVMFRAALAEVVTSLGSQAAQNKKTLYDQLAEMESEGTLHPHLVEWAKEIRLLGNIGAHPNSLGAVSNEDAAELGSLTRQLIEVLFEVPARIARARAARAAPTGATV